MSGLLTYHAENQQTSALCGYGIRQSDVQLFLSDAQVVAATTAEDLVDDVEAAQVHEELESQRQSIVRAIREGATLGDLSNARVAAATSVADLADKTWVSDDANLDHLGINVTP